MKIGLIKEAFDEYRKSKKNKPTKNKTTDKYTETDTKKQTKR